MKSPVNRQNGIIAILDALGASNYSDNDIEQFLQSRIAVLELLNEKIDGMSEVIKRKDLNIFTFNDTILIAYQTEKHDPSWGHISTFFVLLRKFLVDSLVKGILFRGAVSIGSFFIENQSNTVMGQAVTDAAAWYDKADWIGVQATPRTSLIIQRWLEKHSKTKSHLILEYKVPLKDGKAVPVKVVNWPKVFFVPGLTPCTEDQKPKERLLQLLSLHTVPLGTEQKFSNSLDFFDYSVQVARKEAEKKRKSKANVRQNQ